MCTPRCALFSHFCQSRRRSPRSRRRRKISIRTCKRLLPEWPGSVNSQFLLWCALTAGRVRNLSDKAVSVASGLGACGLAHQEAARFSLYFWVLNCICMFFLVIIFAHIYIYANCQATIKDLATISAESERIHKECFSCKVIIRGSFQVCGYQRTRRMVYESKPVPECAQYLAWYKQTLEASISVCRF